mmetsp:Transcript_80837/g.182390  ORF Transcript_80837/g.182390 Transcript_80837/m.182390 type:complete len:244 (+) Transcript_80837:92-823(+)
MASGQESPRCCACRRCSTRASEDRTSKTPSLPMTTNWSSFSKMTSLSSGSEITFCSVGDLLALALYAKSPRARLRLRPASMRQHGPKRSTRPPAPSIRRRSSGLFGFWSTERSMAWPWRLSTARLSPALAHMRRVLPASRRSNVTTAVLPTRSYGCGTADAASRISSSSLWKDLLRASPGSLTSVRKVARIRGSSCTASSETSCPPWPSKTPKRAACSCPGRFNTPQVLSSMCGLIPCCPEQK